MSFQDIPPIEKPSKYLDFAIQQGKKRAEEIKTKVRGDVFHQLQTVERERVKAIHAYVRKRLVQVLKSFPSLDQLSPFYSALVRVRMEYGQIKQSLGGVNWVVKQADKLSSVVLQKMKFCQDTVRVHDLKREYLGRVASFLKRIESDLQYLEQARKIFKEFPIIREKHYTVCIFGFPNVGKTTLLSRFTSSKAEIKPYAFTTKRLNLGYLEQEGKKIQLLDTPGTLNRFEKMNKIEQEAWLAVEHCADAIIYVFDLTEPYPLTDQEKLLEKIEKLKKEVCIYLSKTDILPRERIESFKKQYKIYSVGELREILLKGAENTDNTKNNIEKNGYSIVSRCV